MLPLPRQSKPDRSTRRLLPLALRAGFSLLEIVIALAVLGTMAAGAYLGFNTINTYAVTSRLYSEAQAAAHHQIDLLLSKGPFNITSTPYRVPPELMTSSELTALPLPSQAPSAKPANTDPYYPYYPYYKDGTGLLAKQAFIYTDPVSGKVIVVGTLKTTITPVTASMTYAGVVSDLNVRKANVTVSYTFRNRNYVVSMDTLRAADQ